MNRPKRNAAKAAHDEVARGLRWLADQASSCAPGTGLLLAYSEAPPTVWLRLALVRGLRRMGRDDLAQRLARTNLSDGEAILAIAKDLGSKEGTP